MVESNDGPESLVVRKLVSENECRTLALAIARFVCVVEPKEQEPGKVDIMEEHMPCETCLEMASALVVTLMTQNAVVPIKINNEELAEIILEAMGFEPDKKPLLALEETGDGFIDRAKADMRQNRRQRRRQAAKRDDTTQG